MKCNNTPHSLFLFLLYLVAISLMAFGTPYPADAATYLLAVICFHYTDIVSNSSSP